MVIKAVKLDARSATQEELQTIKGIGLVTAVELVRRANSTPCTSPKSKKEMQDLMRKIGRCSKPAAIEASGHFSFEDAGAGGGGSPVRVSIAVLRARCDAYGLPSDGTWKDLQQRLEFLQQRLELQQAGISLCCEKCKAWVLAKDYGITSFAEAEASIVLCDNCQDTDAEEEEGDLPTPVLSKVQEGMIARLLGRMGFMRL